MTVKTQSAFQLHHPSLSRWKWGRERTHPQSVMGIQRQGHLFHHCLCLVFTIHLLCQKKYTLPLFVLCFHPFAPVIWCSLSLLYFRSKKALQEVSSLPLSCDVLVFHSQISSPIFPLLLNRPFPPTQSSLVSFLVQLCSPLSIFTPESNLPFLITPPILVKGKEGCCQRCAVTPIEARSTCNRKHQLSHGKCKGNVQEIEPQWMRRRSVIIWESREQWPCWKGATVNIQDLQNPWVDLYKGKAFSVPFHCAHKIRIKLPFVVNEGYI